MEGVFLLILLCLEELSHVSVHSLGRGRRRRRLFSEHSPESLAFAFRSYLAGKTAFQFEPIPCVLSTRLVLCSCSV